MAASESLLGNGRAPAPRETPAARAERETLSVPLAWRIGQGVVLALIALVTLLYNQRGGQSNPPVRGDSHGLADHLGVLVLVGLTCITTPTAGTIAATTFHEALRRRWVVALLGVSVVLLVLASNVSLSMQPGSENNSLRDFGVGYIIFITLLMAIFLGVSLVPPEIDRRIILTILAKPVNRLEFLLGKFLGLCLTLGFSLLVMSGVLIGAYAWFNIRLKGAAGAFAVTPDQPGLGFDLTNMGSALFLHFGQLAVVAALALVLSLVVSHITAIVFCFITYLGGQMSSYWADLASNTRTPGDAATGISRGMKGVISVLYYALPRLDKFDVRNQLVTDTPVAFNYVWKAFGSGLIYVAALLLIGYLVFSDREF